MLALYIVASYLCTPFLLMYLISQTDRDEDDWYFSALFFALSPLVFPIAVAATVGTLIDSNAEVLRSKRKGE
jgi:hypothetical protein